MQVDNYLSAFFMNKKGNDSNLANIDYESIIKALNEILNIKINNPKIDIIILSIDELNK